MPYDARDHFRETNKAITDFQRQIGATVIWYEWNPESTPDDTIYDQYGRDWHPGKPMPLYSIIRDEGAEVPSAEGFYTVDTIHCAALLEQLRRAGLSDPYNAQRHLRDRFSWDGFIWEVRRWAIQGRLQTMEATVGIDATKVTEEEMRHDPDFQPYSGDDIYG